LVISRIVCRIGCNVNSHQGAVAALM